MKPSRTAHIRAHSSSHMQSTILHSDYLRSIRPSRAGSNSASGSELRLSHTCLINDDRTRTPCIRTLFINKLETMPNVLANLARGFALNTAVGRCSEVDSVKFQIAQDSGCAGAFKATTFYLLPVKYGPGRHDLFLLFGRGVRHRSHPSHFLSQKSGHPEPFRFQIPDNQPLMSTSLVGHP